MPTTSSSARSAETWSVWKPTPTSPTVHDTADGWIADWIDESDTPAPLAPATIGWLLWHIEWWWTTTLAQVGNQPVTDPTDFLWSSGTDRIVELKAKWDEVLATRSMDEPISWVMPEPQPLGRVAGWLNFELAKNLAEINQTMMLHATLWTSPTAALG